MPAVLTALVLAVGIAAYGLDDGPPPHARTVPAGSWHHLGEGMDTNISGVALYDVAPGRTTALVVRDNKDAGENRVALATFGADGAPVLAPLAWAGGAPSDIEAVDAVPGEPGRFVTLTSDGEGHLITVDASGVRVDRTFSVPEPVSEPNYEGFALAALGGRTVAVWADRGQEEAPATVFAAPFDVAAGRFGRPVRMEVTAPYPTGDARDVSDIKILPDGTLLATAAWEAGDEGPFEGAVYVPGAVAVAGDRVSLTRASGAGPLLALDGRKAEGVACDPGTGSCVLGADDELRGGSLTLVAGPAR